MRVISSSADLFTFMTMKVAKVERVAPIGEGLVNYKPEEIVELDDVVDDDIRG